MQKYLSLKLAACSLITLLCASEVWAGAPFSDYTFEQGIKLAQENNKLFLIDFKASWCQPCKKMEASTWADSSVRSWLKDNAIVIQIDVDENSKLADSFKVNAVPTLVLFTPKSKDQEFAREDGEMSASELLQWLEAAKSGKSAADLQKEANKGAEVWEHFGKVRGLQSAGNNAAVLEEYLWLWSNINESDPNTGPLKTGMLPFELKKLCTRYEPAKTKITEMRDAAEREKNRKEWLILNSILDDNERSLAWFDKAKSDPAERSVIIENTKLIEPFLFAKCRWADAANYLYPDPISKLAQYYKEAEELKRPRPHTEFAKDFDPFPNMVMLLYGAYVGAGRDTEAKKIADECMRLDKSPTMSEALSKMADAMQNARASQAAQSQSPISSKSTSRSANSTIPTSTKSPASSNSTSSSASSKRAASKLQQSHKSTPGTQNNSKPDAK